MTKENAITTAKQFRVDADALLQRMKEHKKALQPLFYGVGRMMTIEEQKTVPPPEENPDDISETIAQHILSIRDLESCIMRQGMALKYIGNPNPYPDSYKPENTIVNPTADGLKL